MLPKSHTAKPDASAGGVDEIVARSLNFSCPGQAQRRQDCGHADDHATISFASRRRRAKTSRIEPEATMGKTWLRWRKSLCSDAPLRRLHLGLVQLIYSSTPFGFDDAMLYGLLVQARRNNARDHVTGALVCRADIYLQLLEGPEAAVQTTYSHIIHDNRHDEVTCHIAGPVEERLFPGWGDEGRSGPLLALDSRRGRRRRAAGGLPGRDPKRLPAGRCVARLMR